MQDYLLKEVTSIIIFIGAAILISAIFYSRQKFLISRLGGFVKSVSMYSRGIKTVRYSLLTFLIILLLCLILVLILINGSDLLLRFIGQCIFLAAMNYAMILYSKMIFCKDGFAGAGIPKTHWHEVKGVIWDRDIGQNEWGVKIFIHGMKKPYRAFFKRVKKGEIEKIFDELLQDTK